MSVTFLYQSCIVEWIINLICYTLPHQCKYFVSVCEILTAKTCGKLSKCTIIVKGGLLPIPTRGPGSRSGSRQRLLVFCLNLLTSEASRYKSRYLSFHVIPPESVLQVLVHFGATWMHGVSCTVSFSHNLILQVFDVRHTQMITKIQHSIYYPEVWTI